MEQKKNKYPFWEIFKREWRRISGSWMSILSVFILPVVGLLLLTAIFNKNVPTDLPIAAVDKDHSSLSREMLQRVNSSSIASIKYMPLSEKEAYDLVKKGKVKAFIVIPENYEKLFLKQEAPSTILYLDNTNIVTSGLITKGMTNVFSQYSQAMKVKYYMKEGLSFSQAVEASKPLKTRVHMLFNPYGNYSYFLLLGLLPLMMLLFVLLNSLHAIGSELKYGTAKEVMDMSNNSIRVTLLAKLLPYTLIFALHLGVMNYLLFRFIDIPVRGNFHIILLSELVLIITHQFIAVFLAGVTANLRLSLSLGSAYSMMAFTFSGLTFPYEGMTVAAKIFSYIFPLKFWLHTFLGQTLRGEKLSNSLSGLIVVFSFFIIGMLFVPLLKRRYLNEKNYGRA